MRKGRKNRRKTGEKLPKNYIFDKTGHKKTRKLKKPVKPQQAFEVTKEEKELRKVSKVEQIKQKTKLEHGQTVNWDSFGGPRKKLQGSGLRPTFMNVKTKTYKRWSKK